MTTANAAMDASQVLEAMNSLPPLCRRVFILMRYHGNTVEEISVLLNIPRYQVRSLFHQAFARCRRVAIDSAVFERPSDRIEIPGAMSATSIPSIGWILPLPNDITLLDVVALMHGLKSNGMQTQLNHDGPIYSLTPTHACDVPSSELINECGLLGAKLLTIGQATLRFVAPIHLDQPGH